MSKWELINKKLEEKNSENTKRKPGRPRIKPIKEKKSIGRPKDNTKVKLKLRNQIANMSDNEAKKLIEYLENLRNNNIEEENEQERGENQLS